MIYIAVGNIKDFDCRWASPSLNENGYHKLKTDFLNELLPAGIVDLLFKRGINIHGKIGSSGSKFYVQRLVATLFYITVGLEIHHLMKLKTMNNIWGLIPVNKGIHDRMTAWKDLEREFNKSIELERELQIAQFAKEYESKLKSKWSNQSSEGVILEILQMKVSGMPTAKIIKKMKGKAGEKKVREHLRTFYHAKEFSEYLEAQLGEEFSDLYANLDEKWKYIVKWEKNRNSNINEFLAPKRQKEGINSNSISTRPKDNVSAEIYYGYELEEIF